MAGATLPSEVRAAAEREGFSGAEYNAVAMGARLSTIKLLNLQLETSPEACGNEDGAELAFDRRVLSCRHDHETDSTAAIFQFGVTVRVEDEVSFRCVADYAVLYEMPEAVRPEAATSFCKHVGSFAAYPYFRAIAAQMAWNAGVELPPLPSIAAMPIVPKPTVSDAPID